MCTLRQQSQFCQMNINFNVVKCWQINYSGKRISTKHLQKMISPNVSMGNLQLHRSAPVTYHRVRFRDTESRAFYCIDTRFYLLFDVKPLRDEKRKHILYDDCLFWFRLWLIVELFHLHLFFHSTRVETSKRCILLESMSNTRRCCRRRRHTIGFWYFAMFTRFNERNECV